MVIHRAVSGSFERFIAILIEHFAGALPDLARAGAGARAPDQRRISEYARRATDALLAAGIRAHLDERSDTLKYKIRDAALLKVALRRGDRPS